MSYIDQTYTIELTSNSKENMDPPVMKQPPLPQDSMFSSDSSTTYDRNTLSTWGPDTIDVYMRDTDEDKEDGDITYTEEPKEFGNSEEANKPTRLPRTNPAISAPSQIVKSNTTPLDNMAFRHHCHLSLPLLSEHLHGIDSEYNIMERMGIIGRNGLGRKKNPGRHNPHHHPIIVKHGVKYQDDINYRRF